MEKLTYNQIFEKASIIRNLPLVCEGRSLPKGMAAKVVLVRVQYEGHIEAFEKEMQEVVKGLKKEGFDERMQKIQRMKEIDKRKNAAENWKEGDTDKEGKPIEKPAMPSDEELKEAEEIRATKAEFDKELEELNTEAMQARNTKLNEEIEIKERKFTSEELAEIIEMLGAEGTIKINDMDVPNDVFINTLAFKFCE